MVLLGEDDTTYASTLEAMQEAAAEPRSIDRLMQWLRAAPDKRLLALLLGLYLLTRFAAMQPYLGDLDATNFALGLRNFDLARFQPHFPGYPVYMACARALYTFGLPAPAALELPGVLLGAPALLLFFLANRRWLGPVRGRLAGALWIACPGLWLAAGKPSSDALGLALLTIAASLLALWWPRFGRGEPRQQRRLGFAIGLSLGLGLGVRLSYLPLALSCMVLLWVASRRADDELRRRSGPIGCLVGLAAGGASWFVPLALVVGPTQLWKVALWHTSGHFNTWGGGLLITASPLWSLQRLAENLFNHGLGMGWTAGPTVVVSVFIGLGLSATVAALATVGSKARRVLPFMLVLLLPYLLWIVVAQNPEKPRHVLPLLVVMVVLLVAGVPFDDAGHSAKRRWASLISTLAVLAVGAVGLSRIKHARFEPSPAFQLVRHVASKMDPEGMVIYGGEEIRLFAYYAPWVRAKRASTQEDILADLSSGLRPPRIVVSSKVRSWSSLRNNGRLQRIGSFTRDPMVDPHYARIELFSFEPAGALASEVRR